MTFNGKEGEEISLAKGSELTSAYRNLNPGETLGHFFGKEILNQILEQDGCMGIRIYYGLGEDNSKQLVLVGADEAQNDMTQLVADVSHPCPPLCSQANPLNS